MEHSVVCGVVLVNDKQLCCQDVCDVDLQFIFLT